MKSEFTEVISEMQCGSYDDKRESPKFAREKQKPPLNEQQAK